MCAYERACECVRCTNQFVILFSGMHGEYGKYCFLSFHCRQSRGLYDRVHVVLLFWRDPCSNLSYYRADSDAVNVDIRSAIEYIEFCILRLWPKYYIDNYFVQLCCVGHITAW